MIRRQTQRKVIIRLLIEIVMLEFNVHCIFSSHFYEHHIILHQFCKNFLDRGPQVY